MENDEQITGICSGCGSELAPIMENQGFEPPAGPSHYEIVGYKLCECRRMEE